MPANANLFAALRAGFPAELDRVAVETIGADAFAYAYTWRDLDHGSAMIANLLQSIGLDPGTRVAAQTAPSAEALMLCLAVWRAGLVLLPIDTEIGAAGIEHVIGDAQPTVVVAASKDFGQVSKIAFRAGSRHVFTLDDDRRGSLLQRALHHRREQVPATVRADDLAAIGYTADDAAPRVKAMLSHADLLSLAGAQHAWLDWRGGAGWLDR